MAAKRLGKKTSQTHSAKRSDGRNEFETLTIEFAGICALVASTRDSSKAEVWLVKVEKAIPKRRAGHAPHCATLVAPVLEQQAPNADRAIAVPGKPAEYAVWDLGGKKVTFLVDGKPPTDLKINIGKNLPNIGALASKGAEPKLRKSHLPITTKVKITGGMVSAPTPSKNQALVEFAGTSAAQRYSNRFKLQLRFRDNATIKFGKQDGRKAKLTFTQTTTVVVGNVCQEMRQEPRHFDAFYGLLKAKKGPRIDGGGGGAFITPEFCIPAMLLIKAAIPYVPFLLL